MTALIAWLDASSEDQRRMREIVSLFSERESRDELGIGQVRDALSDLLWPGTSTLFTRARYFLFIPWCYRAAAETRSDVEKSTALADRNERRLIRGLLDAGEKPAWLVPRSVFDSRTCRRRSTGEACACTASSMTRP
ncbi:DUF6361 family protein [Mycolicibacterium sp.]|uniref:DUF6361 family protein n=1 Tax=Mycolicibacterium sp. TaxID=2320850 RepID=UPI0037CA4ED9